MLHGVIEPQTGLVAQQLLGQRADCECPALDTQVYVPWGGPKEKEISMQDLAHHWNWTGLVLAELVSCRSDVPVGYLPEHHSVYGH